MSGSALWQRTAQLTLAASTDGGLVFPFDPANVGSRMGGVTAVAGSIAGANIAANQLTVLDLSQMHFRFRISGEDTESPNTMVLRIYNLSANTVATIIDEYDQVNLQVGYVNGPQGIIFCGEIKQFLAGHENATDTFLEISAADGDHGYNFGFVNKVFAPGSTPADVFLECAARMNMGVDPDSLAFAKASGVVFPRGQVKFNLARVHMRDLAASLTARWSIKTDAIGANPTLYLIPNTGYLKNEVIVLGPDTGLIGFPEATDNGISVTCLINPLMKIGATVSLSRQSITEKIIIAQGFETYGAIDYVANVGDFLYRVMSMDMSGDSRGNDWTARLICLAIDQTNPAAPVVLNP